MTYDTFMLLFDYPLTYVFAVKIALKNICLLFFTTKNEEGVRNVSRLMRENYKRNFVIFSEKVR